MCKTPKMPIPTALPPPQAPKAPNLDAMRASTPFTPDMPPLSFALMRKGGAVGNGLIGGSTLLGGGTKP